MSDCFQTIVIRKYQGEECASARDTLAQEEPLQITLDGVPLAVVMRTGGHDEDLVDGFLYTEGVIRERADLRRIDLNQKKNHALVFLEDGVDIDHQRFQRNLYSASSCGICGKASIEAICQKLPEITSKKPFERSIVLQGPTLLRSSQEVFDSTGGLHAAALISRDGTLLCVREDVGRHNAIDKVIGWAWRNQIGMGDYFLQVSGRVSFEVMQKALSAGISTVSAISAPTSLAVEFAREAGQTLLGFVRGENFNLYAGEISEENL